MEKALKNFPMEIIIPDNMLTEDQKDMANIFGRMVVITRDNLKMD